MERATEAVGRFAALFEQHWLDGMRAKLGLFTREDEDAALVNDLLAWMQRRSADFTNTFRSLSHGGACAGSSDGDPDRESWQQRWLARRGRQPQPSHEADSLMRRHNPAFIPRNHNVEAALTAAVSSHDLSVMEQLLEVLAAPFDHDRDLPMYSEPGARTRQYVTYCGT